MASTGKKEAGPPADDSNLDGIGDDSDDDSDFDFNHPHFGRFTHLMETTTEKATEWIKQHERKMTQITYQARSSQVLTKFHGTVGENN